MNSGHEGAKNIADVAASGGSALVVISHWADMLTPIVALAVGVLTLIWWGIRLYDRWRLGPKGADDE